MNSLTKSLRQPESNMDSTIPLSAAEQFIQACPSRQLIEVISNKWILYIIWALDSGTMRNNELLRKIEIISQKMLTQTLKEMIQQGWVIRTDYQTVPPHVDYRLSSLGMSLSEVLRPLDVWAAANIK
ncbi:winged helix-turn-helix transcriptional regulator [Aquirhabdus sp.]|uniref:winged helix-turn-helix transcriptional regulator n=1 Tax=Aquirhabdus sp. TaxID=2824160 RepID=UPI00396CE7B7